MLEEAFEGSFGHKHGFRLQWETIRRYYFFFRVSYPYFVIGLNATIRTAGVLRS